MHFVGINMQDLAFLRPFPISVVQKKPNEHLKAELLRIKKNARATKQRLARDQEVNAGFWQRQLS